MNVHEYQRRKFEGLLAADNKLTQETQQTMQTIIKNAMMCGQTHARVQTLRLASQYAYTFLDPPSPSAHVIHDTHTLAPMEGIRMRINLSSGARELTEWLLRQGVCFVLASQRMMPERVYGEPVMTDYVHVMAVFVPEAGGAGGGVTSSLSATTPRLLTLWNTVYTQKCLDASMIPAWNERCLFAMRAGCAHFVVCTLYRFADYDSSPAATRELVCTRPRNHLTMALLVPDPKWALESKFSTLVSWCAQLGYAWTLGASGGDDSNAWAYFIVMLDPLSGYY
jgi:hypothetical protein